ncbi:hypothetical protein AgCh_039568 [Apium graveolens]
MRGFVETKQQKIKALMSKLPNQKHSQETDDLGSKQSEKTVKKSTDLGQQICIVNSSSDDNDENSEKIESSSGSRKRIRRANVKGKKGRGKKGGFQKQNRSGGDECGDSGAKDEGFVQENDNLGGGFDGEGQDKELKKKSSDFVVLEGQDFEKLGGSGYQGFRDEMEVSERNGKQKKVNYQETTELRRCQKKNVKIIKNVDNEELDEFSPEDDLFPKRRKKSLTNKDGGGNCRTQTRGQKRKETDTNKSLTDENGEPLQVMCHQCRRNDRDRVVICGNCKLKGYCVHCMTTWSCPVCQINCNCIRCLRMKVPQGDKKKLNLSMSFTNEEKIQSSKYIVSTLLPFLKQFNEEQMREKHIEAQVQGLSLSELEVEKAKRGLGERMHCDNCKASIADFHRSCTNCAYNLCLVCCQELRDGCLQGSQEEMNIKILDPGSAYMHGGNLKSSSGISNETTGEDRHPASTLYIQVKASNEDHSRSTSQWKPLKDGNIPCPPNTSGGCSKGILKLLCLRGKDFVLKLLAGAEELSYKYKLITETPGQRCSCFDSVGEIGTNKLKSLKAASREDFSDNYLYCPAAGELQAKDSSHFQYHWLKGEPVIVSNVLESTRGLSWEPMVMCRAVRQIKHFNRSQLLDVVAVDCLNWREVDVNSRQFFNGYLEGKFDNYGWPQILKLEDWPPSITFEELLPRHNAEFLSSLSFKEYTNPRGGYLNLVVKLPEKSNHPDTGPKMCIAYGNAQELGRGDSVTKLHSDMTDVVNVLTHIQEVTFTSAQQAKIDKLKQRHIAQDKREIFGSEQIVNNKVEKQQDVNEKKRTELDEHAGNIDVGTWDNNVEGIEHPGGGALWDIFRRQDSPKLEEYLKKNFREFRHINCRPLDQAVHPIHDRTFYLTLDHKRRLKEEYGIEPWTFVQKRGDAVYIPAGCPNQVRNIKSCIKVSMGFVSPENVSESIRLAEEIRVLPQNHSAKVDNLEIKKLILYAIAQAVRDLEKLPAKSMRDLTAIYTRKKAADGLVVDETVNDDNAVAIKDDNAVVALHPKHLKDSFQSSYYSSSKLAGKSLESDTKSVPSTSDKVVKDCGQGSLAVENVPREKGAKEVPTSDDDPTTSKIDSVKQLVEVVPNTRSSGQPVYPPSTLHDSPIISHQTRLSIPIKTVGFFKQLEDLLQGNTSDWALPPQIQLDEQTICDYERLLKTGLSGNLKGLFKDSTYQEFSEALTGLLACRRIPSNLHHGFLSLRRDLPSLASRVLKLNSEITQGMLQRNNRSTMKELESCLHKYRKCEEQLLKLEQEKEHNVSEIGRLKARNQVIDSEIATYTAEADALQKASATQSLKIANLDVAGALDESTLERSLDELINMENEWRKRVDMLNF